MHIKSANEVFSFVYIYIKVIFQFLLCRTLTIVDITDDMTMFQKGDTRTDIHRMVEVVAGYEDSGTSLLVLLFQQMFNDRLRTWVKEVEWFVENQHMWLVE